MNTKIVYLAHTQERILNDAVFSILNLVAQGLEKTGAEVIVATDSPAHFDGLPVTVRPISQAEIEDWKGEIDFIHRLKPVLLHKIAEKFKHSKIIFFDADTAVRTNIQVILDEISDSVAVMHASEGTVGDSPIRVYHGIRAKIDSGELDSEGLRQTEVYNTGVIGLPPGRADLFSEVIRKVDRAYPILWNHVVEQVMFSWVLARDFNVVDTSGSIFHWWGKGLNTGPMIQKFLAGNVSVPLDEKADKAAHLVSALEAAPMNPRPGFVQKLRRSIRKRLR